VLTKIFFR